jgi:hypothetical protein
MTEFHRYLEFDLGIHPDVIHFLVDRPTPLNNEYWKERASFLSKSPGYLFIPILFDLFLKSGIDKSVILSELHIHLIEEILHLAARQEREQLTYLQLHEKCRMVIQKEGIALDEILRADQALVHRPFMRIPVKFQSLQRANSYLYSAVLLPNDYAMIFQLWESLMPFFLFLDDLTDLNEDIANQSENCLLDSQGVQDNFFILHPLMTELLKRIELINSRLFHQLDRMRKEAVMSAMNNILMLPNF